ncbi:sulfurtransferase TusA family protein [Parvibium lacunae]|uniref:Sulfurtransferase TusA family protein n=1 Tax=Parvibium lacunae TaxID=1888893 RepID=A0A368KZR7_9BURK|nr:sulfurtransferase TusA family protein [Parvibium lacunae]RCS56511.1 sulfurtransferase TusA family protein [Parvibium lacunae]
MEPNQVLDTSGLQCPLPILRTKKALAPMLSGEILKVIATDPGAADDFPAFAKQTGNALLAEEKEGDTFIFYMQRR